MKVMTFDIETTPCIGYFWRPGYNLNITHDAIIEDAKIICISYKFLDEKKVNNLHFDIKKQCDKQLMKKFAKEFNKADLLVAHNGKKFDLPWIHARAIKHDVHLNDVPMLDTLQKVRQKFKFASNRLDYITQHLGIAGKMSTGGFDLWKRVMDGDKKALKKMCKYCDQDVKILEELYKKIAPRISHPVSMSIFKDNTLVCANPACGSCNLQKMGYNYSKTGKKQRFRCLDCGKTQSTGANLVKKSSGFVRD